MNTIAPVWEQGFRVIGPQINPQGTHHHQFDPAFPIDIRFFSFSGRDCVRMNRHHYWEIYSVASGKTTLQVQDRLFKVQENDMVVIGGDLYHRHISPPNDSLRLIVLYFEPELIRTTDGTSEEMEFLTPFLTQNADFPHVISRKTKLPGEILGLMLRIHEELPASTALARLAVKTYLKMILMLLVKHYSVHHGTQEDIHRKRADIERLQALFSYLETNFYSPILVGQAARLSAMSKSHFMYFFKRATGQSFRSYLTRFRIAKAQNLLASTYEPISLISQAAGFCDQSHFGMVFRKLVGATPLAYRRQSAKARGIERAGVQSSPIAARAMEAPRDPYTTIKKETVAMNDGAMMAR
jgi:AraC-like DNA-binding protein